jgi:RND family efflux transporter MFP subunit
LTLARDLYQRQEALWKQNIGTEVQFLQAKNQVEAIEKSKATIQYQMQKANIYAPTSGVVDKVFVKQGEMAMPSAPIIQIVNFNAVIVKAEVSVTYLKTLKLGDVVKIDFPALEQEQTGKIVEIGRAVNPANRTVPVKIDISNARGLIKPNLLANVFIKDVNIGGAIVIPTELIMQETDGRSYVFIKNDTDGTLSSKKVYVETGESYDGQSTITAGLKGGEYLIVKGFKETTDGEWIKILEEEPNPAIMDISEKKRLDKNTPATTNQVQKTVAQ